MYALEGSTINHIYMSRGEGTIIFDTDTGLVIYNAIGDCCSESWFSDIYGLDALLGHQVSSVLSVDMPDYDLGDGRGRQESDQVYGYTLVTDAGYADIVFRNSSNGYYGGWLVQVDADTINLDTVTADFTPLSGSDWKA